MKKIIASLALIAMGAVTVHAQQTDQPEHRNQQQHFSHRGGDRIAKNLHFSDAQKEQLKSINADYRKKIMDLKKNEDITVRESSARLRALQLEHKTQMQALLTPEQKDQLAKMKHDRGEMGKVNAVARAEKMKIKLGLNDVQAGQLKNLHTDVMAKMKSIHSDSALSTEQKREQFKALVVQQKEQLKTILSPEQLQQLEQMKATHHKRDFVK